MPNHCSQNFSFTGSQKDIQQLYRHIVNVEGERPMVDFNRITAMPEALNIENTNQGQKALALLQANPNQSVINTDLFPHAYQLVQALPKYGFEWQSLTVGQAIVVLENESDLQLHFGLDFGLGRQYQQNLQQYGSFSWYHWRLEHWGTKWNAYHCELEFSEDGTCLSGYLETAWSPAEPIYRKLAQVYPSVSVEIEYMDEFAEFAGVYRSDGQGGLMDEEYTDEQIDALFS